MEDLKINELIKSNCYQCVIGSSSIDVLVPYGALEQFVNMCIRSGHSVMIVSRKCDMII